MNLRSVLKCQAGPNRGKPGPCPGPESRLPPTSASAARPRVPPRDAAARNKDRRPPTPATPEQVGQLRGLVDAVNAAAPDADRDYLPLRDLRLEALDRLGWNWQTFDAALYEARRRGLLRLRVNDGTSGPPHPFDRAAGFDGEDGELYDRVSPVKKLRSFVRK